MVSTSEHQVVPESFTDAPAPLQPSPRRVPTRRSKSLRTFNEAHRHLREFRQRVDEAADCDRCDVLFEPCADLIDRLLRVPVLVPSYWTYDLPRVIASVRQLIGNPEVEGAHIEFHDGPLWPERPAIRWSYTEWFDTGIYMDEHEVGDG